MTNYRAPISDMTAALTVAGMDDIAALPGYEDASDDMVTAILEEAGKLAGGILAPLNAPGDRQGCSISEDGAVTTPDGFPAAYQQFVEGGWNGVPFDPDFGGQGLPLLLGTALFEMWQAANMSFGLCPMLTVGSIELLTHHGSKEQKATWLPKLISGEWTGTMNLTEPQAGSDLAAVRTKATPAPDLGQGIYRIQGGKIFITHGDHDMSANIVHMVLARLSDAPPGIKGISLFIVPKFLLNNAGEPGEHNDLRAVSLEHKLGIHASPTCVMAFGDKGGAIGYLVGEENRGIEYMFTMMNNARLAVGVQGVGIAERATQAAVDYARGRVQGPDPARKTKGAVSIIHMPDVRRMLMTMRALTQAARLITFQTAAELDRAKAHPDESTRATAESRAALLTPIAKAWSTEVGIQVANLGIQVHGGLGFIEETGAAQYLRDARIAAIYEGTNGIQAIDLVGRKLIRDKGAALSALLAEMRATQADLTQVLPDLGPPLGAALDDVEAARAWILENSDPVNMQSAATPFLNLIGLATGGWLLGKLALNAMAGTGGDPAHDTARLTVAGFFLRHLLPATGGHLAAIRAGAGDLMALDEDALTPV
ncbi:MAG: acyl-CoA dehydrogenase [Rhodospirillum sp.]|nr:acyl-CoA dehydrogenase [Rhodospirillum sp.]MCF8488642.1 acyl-CoA dehydrogenase [Rhodospirillum sp.]MCF8500683.1 acyl-CoA dehydrogenase [Rhodospirillum sp.]